MKELEAWCKEHSIRFLRVGWVDSGGVLRAEAVTTRHLDSILQDGMAVVPAVQAALPLGDVVEDPDLSATLRSIRLNDIFRTNFVQYSDDFF